MYSTPNRSYILVGGILASLCIYALVYVKYEYVCTCGISMSKYPKQTRYFNGNDTLHSFVQKLTDSKRRIFVALIDNIYLDMGMNLYLSFKRLGIKNYLFISSDQETCDFMMSKSINCYFYKFNILKHKKVEHVDHGFRSPSFNLKSNLRITIVKEMLILGCDLILMDLDIVMLRNPIPYFTCDTCDMETHMDAPTVINTGFYYVKSNNNSIAVFSEAERRLLNSNTSVKVNDQPIINTVVNEQVAKKEFKFKGLNTTLFDHAEYFKKVKTFTLHHLKNTVIVHSTYLSTGAAKIYKFKEYSLWFYDKNGYYSNGNGNYLVYENPLNEEEIDGVFPAEITALKTALSIGYLLNRTVILPSFACGYHNHEGCSFEKRFHVQTFDKHFGGFYREHIFLEHKLVPKKVKRSNTDVFVIDNDFILKRLDLGWNMFKPGVHLKPAKKDIVTPQEILKWFTKYNNKHVLQFNSLYGIKVDLSGDTKYENFLYRLKNGLLGSEFSQKSTYKL